MADEANLTLEKVAAKLGVAPESLAAGPSPLHPDGWVLGSRDETVALRLDMTEQSLHNVCTGTYALRRLPRPDAEVVRWVAAHKADPDEEPWLLLRGTTGCGKTSQSLLVTAELARHNARTNPLHYPWYFTTHRDLAAEMRPGGDLPPEAALKKYEDAALVVLDDLGDYQATDWAVDCTVRLINHRYSKRLPTVYNTNLPFYRTEALAEQENRLGTRIATLSDTLDGRVLSRLSEAWTIDLPEIDHRQGRNRAARG